MQKELRLVKSIWTIILIGSLIYLGWLLIELSSILHYGLASVDTGPTKQNLTKDHQGLGATLKIVEQANREFQIQNLKSLQARIDQLIR